MNELRLQALRQAADDEKHSGGVAYSVAPDPAAIISRAETYLRFLFGQSVVPARKALARKKVARKP